jgi:hypothetical protein
LLSEQLTQTPRTLDRPRALRPRPRPPQQLIDLPERCPHPQLTELVLDLVQSHCRMRSLVRINTDDHANHAASKNSTDE